MGLVEWIKRKMDETKMRNDAKHNALKAMYDGDEYKKVIMQQEIARMKENKGNPTGEWLKRVSNNVVANNLSRNRLKLNKNKLFGKR